VNFYVDGLTTSQIRVLNQIAPFATERQFYMGGGTALSIFLRHRRSVDLDWFTQERFEDPMAFAQALRDAAVPFLTSQTAPATLHGQVEDVRVSFMEFRYPLLSHLVYWPDIGAYLASLDDLSCMKLSAIAQRGAKKDFIDVYALCNTHRTLEEMLEMYQQKFSVTDIGPVLYGLVYFDDADEERDPLMLENIQWSDVKQAFRNWVKVIR
jgi:Nucleotidyl transferase AbiEii toxin, Type IV TA system